LLFSVFAGRGGSQTPGTRGAWSCAARGSPGWMIRDAFTRAFAGAVVGLRWLLVPAWLAAAAGCLLLAPGLRSGDPLALGGLVPSDADAIAVAERSAQHFRVPLTADTVVVQRDPDGLSAETQGRVLARAVAATRSQDNPEGIAFALPVANTLGLFPSSRERGTTALTYLFFGPEASLPDQVEAANAYATTINRPDDALVGVTGPAPARFRQFEEIDSHLTIVEAATVGLILFVVGLTFRALGAPLLTLLAAAIAFFVSGGVIPWVANRLDVVVPEEVEPLVVALTLGIVTDYAIFYLAAYRRRLLQGEPRVKAARAATVLVTPIVATAGLIVVAGTGALLVGEIEIFRAFAPPLAITAAVSLVVSVTLIPSLLALVGYRLLWPGVRAADIGRTAAGEFSSPTREAAARFVSSGPVSIVLVVLCGALLLAAATGLTRTELAFRLISGLPADTQEREAARAAGLGFAPGVLAPTVLFLEEPGVAEDRGALVGLQQALAQQPGVAGVLGPREQIPQIPENLFVSADGNAARFVVILDDDPLSAPAINAFQDLEDRVPGLLSEAGLEEAEAGLTGQTALASQTVEAVVGSSARVGAVVVAVNFVLLALFLRALVAPLYLLAASVASVAAALGLTTLFFQGLLGHSDITYYVPFAAGVLLVSLGSDYNVYVVGRIWDELRERELRDAIAVAVPRASKAISVAGIALALSFAALAIVPVDAFREFAFMMCVGVLIETFIVRTFLVPALISVFGRTSTWPGRKPALRPAAESPAPPRAR
jgi:putative drug exporter of the RND superfamily